MTKFQPTDEKFGGVRLEEKETLTARVDRMGEPSRSLLRERCQVRLREVRERLGRGGSSAEEIAVEMYLAGVFDGSQMEKSRLGSSRPGLIIPE